MIKWVNKDLVIIFQPENILLFYPLQFAVRQ